MTKIMRPEVKGSRWYITEESKANYHMLISMEYNIEIVEEDIEDRREQHYKGKCSYETL